MRRGPIICTIGLDSDRVSDHRIIMMVGLRVVMQPGPQPTLFPWQPNRDSKRLGH